MLPLFLSLFLLPAAVHSEYETAVKEAGIIAKQMQIYRADEPAAIYEMGRIRKIEKDLANLPEDEEEFIVAEEKIREEYNELHFFDKMLPKIYIL